ncbi:MAG: VF530 family protein [Verrucomicrobiota bacterium]
MTSGAPPELHPKDPLHGITLEAVVKYLVDQHGWEEMGRRIPIRCFLFNPSLKSSLTFLRKTPWARLKVEEWFVTDQVRKHL